MATSIMKLSGQFGWTYRNTMACAMKFYKENGLKYVCAQESYLLFCSGFLQECDILCTFHLFSSSCISRRATVQHVMMTNEFNFGYGKQVGQDKFGNKYFEVLVRI